MLAHCISTLCEGKAILQVSGNQTQPNKSFKRYWRSDKCHWPAALSFDLVSGLW